MNQNTAHPDRYQYANIAFPAIAQAVYMCKLDGNLVLDLELHDEDHDSRKLVDNAADSVGVDSPAEVDSSVYRITEPAVDTVPEAVLKSTTPNAPLDVTNATAATAAAKRSTPRPVKDSPQA